MLSRIAWCTTFFNNSNVVITFFMAFFSHSGSNITTKDVHNLRSQMERERIRGLTVEEQVWELLHDLCEEDEASQYSLITEGDEKEIEVLFKQSSYMRHIFQNYPDVFFTLTVLVASIDTTIHFMSF